MRPYTSASGFRSIRRDPANFKAAGTHLPRKQRREVRLLLLPVHLEHPTFLQKARLVSFQAKKTSLGCAHLVLRQRRVLR